MDREETLSVALAPSVALRLHDAARAGAYRSLSDLLDDLLDERELIHNGDGWDQDELRRLIQEGADSGPGIPAEEVFSRLIAKYEVMASR